MASRCRRYIPFIQGFLRSQHHWAFKSIAVSTGNTWNKKQNAAADGGYHCHSNKTYSLPHFDSPFSAVADAG
jgi:hypothetical protein